MNYFQLFSFVVNKSNFWNALFLTGISMVFNFLMTLSQRANKLSFVYTVFGEEFAKLM